MQSYDRLVKAIQTYGALEKADAIKVAELYLRERIVRYGSHDGQLIFAHGGFLDSDVLCRALAQA